MGSQHVKLLGFCVSPFSRRVEWAPKLKGVDYEYLEEDTFNKSSLLLQLNPLHKKIPVLVHRQKVISESYVIVEYIDNSTRHGNRVHCCLKILAKEPKPDFRPDLEKRR